MPIFFLYSNKTWRLIAGLVLRILPCMWLLNVLTVKHSVLGNVFLIMHRYQCSRCDGASPLFDIAVCGNIEFVQMLLEHRAVVNDSNNYALTSLHAAGSRSYPGHTTVARAWHLENSHGQCFKDLESHTRGTIWGLAVHKVDIFYGPADT